MSETKKPELIFAPGCFDSFEGTQEELDALVKEIQDMFNSGEAFAKAIPVEDLDDDELMAILDSAGGNDSSRTLQ
jgi:hypothetical protein